MSIQTVRDLDHKRTEAVDAIFSYLKPFALEHTEDTAGKTVKKMTQSGSKLFTEFTDGTHIAFDGEHGRLSFLEIHEFYILGVLPHGLYYTYINASRAKDKASRAHTEEHVARKTLKEAIEKLGRDKVLALLTEEKA